MFMKKECEIVKKIENKREFLEIKGVIIEINFIEGFRDKMKKIF